MADRRTLMIHVPSVAPLGLPLDRPEFVQEVWDAFVRPGQDAGELQSVEMRMLMAILRAVYVGLTETSGAQLIADERRRQVDVEGFSAEHDEVHHVHRFVQAAGAYLSLTSWPWSPDSFKPAESDGRYHERDLVKAGSLIAAAIDRLRAGDRG